MQIANSTEDCKAKMFNFTKEVKYYILLAIRDLSFLIMDINFPCLVYRAIFFGRANYSLNVPQLSLENK